ncbi:MAG: hypothetical protein AAF587_21940 [Bacteroidota bacterium]
MTEVHLDIEDGIYGWKAGFLWETQSSAFQLSVRIQLFKDSSCSSWQLEEMKKICQREFRRFFHSTFLFREPFGSYKPVCTSLIFTEDQPHLQATVFAQHGETALPNWYLKEHPIHLAHELGHQLGLKDEYEDSYSQDRKSTASEAIFRDHSLMGNYALEGWKKANLKLRHGKRIAELISPFTQKSYAVALNPEYEVQAGDGLGWIAQRYFGDEMKWREIYDLNRDIIPYKDQLQVGTHLLLPI